MAHANDMLGYPVAVGDTIAYSAPAGTGSSDLNLGRVEKIIPVIQHPNGEPGYYVREDQLGKSKPTRFRKPGGVVQVRPISRYAPHDVHSDYPRKTLTATQMRNYVRVEIPAGV